MEKILEKSGKSQGILSEEKSGNPDYKRNQFARKMHVKSRVDFSHCSLNTPSLVNTSTSAQRRLLTPSRVT